MRQSLARRRRFRLPALEFFYDLASHRPSPTVVARTDCCGGAEVRFEDDQISIQLSRKASRAGNCGRSQRGDPGGQ